MDRYRTMLHDYALSHLDDQEDAEEAVKPWAQIVEHVHTLEMSDSGTPDPWFWNIHRNVERQSRVR